MVRYNTHHNSLDSLKSSLVFLISALLTVAWKGIRIISCLKIWNTKCQTASLKVWILQKGLQLKFFHSTEEKKLAKSQLDNCSEFIKWKNELSGSSNHLWLIHKKIIRRDKSPCNTPDLKAQKSRIQQFVQSKNYLYLLTHKMNLINRQNKHTT